MISDPLHVRGETRIFFEKIQQIVRAHTRRTDPLAGEIFPDGDACCAARTNPGLPFVPTCPRLLCLFEFSVDLRLPVHEKDYNLGVIIGEMFYRGYATV